MPKLKKANRHRQDIPLLLSTDIAGILFFKPELYYQLYQTISADAAFLDGVEFLPFRFNHHLAHHHLHNLKIPILGVHGPLAWNTPDKSWSEKMYAMVFAQVTSNLKTAFNITAINKPKYLLFHEPDLDQCQLHHQLSKFLKRDRNPIIMIENVYRPNSLQLSVDKVLRLHQQNRAGIMIDLVHLLQEVMGIFSSFKNYHHQLTAKNMTPIWQKMLIAMDQALQQIQIAGLHIPIGTNHDSLPWDLLTTAHWQALSQLLDKHQRRLIALTLENQHPETILGIRKKDLPAIIKDKKKKIKSLVRNRVI